MIFEQIAWNSITQKNEQVVKPPTEQLNKILPAAKISYSLIPETINRITIQLTNEAEYHEAKEKLQTFCEKEDFLFYTQYDLDDNESAELIELITPKYIWPRPEYVYHVTPVSRMESIHSKGIGVTNAENTRTNFPDTLGRLHTSKVLNYDKYTPGDSAAWWKNHFEFNYKCEFTILKVSLKILPYDARVYEDPRSMWGIIIDRVPPIRDFVEVTPKEILPLNPCEMFTSSVLTRRVERLHAKRSQSSS